MISDISALNFFQKFDSSFKDVYKYNYILRWFKMFTNKNNKTITTERIQNPDFTQTIEHCTIDMHIVAEKVVHFSYILL